MTEAPKTPSEPLAPFNLGEPIWLAVDQTEHRTYTETFTGWDAEENAKAYAAVKAGKTGRDVVLFGPQAAVARPPKSMAGTVERVALSQPPKAERAA